MNYLSYLIKKHAVICLFFAFTACSCSKKFAEHPMNFDLSSDPTQVEQTWKNKFAGLVTDLSVSKDGQSILLATLPDPDSDNPGAKQYRLQLMDYQGKVQWTKTLQNQVKSLSISNGGELSVYSNHVNEVIGIKRDGKVAWTTEGTCKPIILEKSKQILCYHDDDAEPETAFDVFDWEGKKLISYSIKRDILGLKISEDEQWIALALTRGQVVLVNSQFKESWQKKVAGEILDLSVSSGPTPWLGVLYNVGKKSQKTTFFDQTGKVRAEAVPLSHVEQIELTPDGKNAILYGNGPKGQYLASYPLITPSKGIVNLKESWHRGDSRYADFASSMIVTNLAVIVGFEDISQTERHTHLMGFDPDGKLKWQIPLRTEEGAYIYSMGFSSEKNFLVVGTDDSSVSGFVLGKAR